MKHKMAHAVVAGPTGSGKSSLMDRLLRRKRKRPYTSTSVADAVVTVCIEQNPSTFQVVDGDTWEEVGYDQSMLEQIKQAPSRFSSVKSREGSQHLSQGGREEEKQSPIQFVSNQGPPKATDVSDLPGSTKEVRRVVIPLARKYGGVKKFKSVLKKISLYLRDTGGQVEFQEMLPLLVFGPSLFLFVFRLDLDFNECFQLEYRGTDKSLNCYTSSISIKEALLQSLASIKAMDAPQTASIKTHDSLVFIVGTHKKNLGQYAKEKIAGLNKTLKSLIKENGYSDLVQHANRRQGEVMFTVDNKTDDDDDVDFAVIRSRISGLIRSHDQFTIEFPISYLLFSMDIQSLNSNVLTIQECREIAEKYGITGEGELKRLLDFLHLRVGIIQYFDIEGVRHIVLKEAQVLFNMISDLIIKTFSCQDTFMPRELEEFEKGILSLSAFRSVVNEGGKITPKEFLHLLSRLRIIAPLSRSQSEGEERYFVPCVLNHVHDSSKEDKMTTKVSPLGIKFKCCHTPKGLFGVLITHFMSPESDEAHGRASLTLMEEEIFRDKVSFKVRCPGEVHVITLRAFSSHLEVFFYPGQSDGCSSVLPIKACSTVRQIVESSISTLSQISTTTRRRQSQSCAYPVHTANSLIPLIERHTRFTVRKP